MTWFNLLGLIACNAIWATNPAMGKILLREFSPLETSWLRYFSALVTAAVFFVFLRFLRPAEISPRRALTAKNYAWLLALGLCTFFGSAYFQYVGLSLSTSTANSLIVATEPLCAVLLAWIFLREAFSLPQIGAFSLAILGFCLLSNMRPNDLQGSLASFNVGNLLILLAIPCEAMYSVISRKLAHRLTPMTIFAIALPLGFLAFNVLYFSRGLTLPSLEKISMGSWLAILWLGPLGTTITYMFWTLALKDVPVAAASLTLFVQPILGALNGVIFLGDRLDLWQSAGAALILSALILQTVIEWRKT